MVDFDGGSFRRETLSKMESSDVAYGPHHKPKPKPKILTKTIRVLSCDESRAPSLDLPERAVANILLSPVSRNVTGRSAEEMMCCGCWVFVVKGVLGLTKETWERHRCRAHSVVVIAVLPRRSENRTIIGEARRWVNGVGEEGGGRRCGKGMRIPVRRRSGELRTSRRSEHGTFSHRTKRSQGGAVVDRGTEDKAVETENEEETRCWRVVAGAERATPTAKGTVDVEERGFQICLDYRDRERKKYEFF
ncbi:unnamed protein product [Brassica oleracea]